LLGSHIPRGAASRRAAIARLWGVASRSGRLAVCPATGRGGGHLLLLLRLTDVGRGAGLLLQLLLLAVSRLLHAAVGGGNWLHSGKRTVGGRSLLGVCRSRRLWCSAVHGGLGCLLSWHCAIPTLLLLLLGHAVRAGLLLRLLASITARLLLLLDSIAASGSAAGGLSNC
jgi:hypothetical protein